MIGDGIHDGDYVFVRKQVAALQKEIKELKAAKVGDPPPQEWPALGVCWISFGPGKSSQ